MPKAKKNTALLYIVLKQNHEIIYVRYIEKCEFNEDFSSESRTFFMSRQP